MSAPTLHAIGRVAQEARTHDLAIVAAETDRGRELAAVEDERRAPSSSTRIDTWSPSTVAAWGARVDDLEQEARLLAFRFEHFATCTPCRERWQALALEREEAEHPGPRFLDEERRRRRDEVFAEITGRPAPLPRCEVGAVAAAPLGVLETSRIRAQERLDAALAAAERRAS